MVSAQVDVEGLGQGARSLELTDDLAALERTGGAATRQLNPIQDAAERQMGRLAGMSHEFLCNPLN